MLPANFKGELKMKKLVIYVHGKGGNAKEAEHLAPFFKNADICGFDYKSETPWEAKEEFLKFFERKTLKYDDITLVANSIGAFFSLNALSKAQLSRAFFISPIVNMEKLIENMMLASGVTKKELEEKKEIPTSFGETLSWDYLCCVKNNPINWNVPTHILYGEHDALTSYETICEFAKNTPSKLTVMKNGEHWFHTEDQLKFLDEWLESSQNSENAAD